MDISNVYETIRNCLDNLYLLKEFNKTDSKHLSQSRVVHQLSLIFFLLAF